MKGTRDRACLGSSGTPSDADLKEKAKYLLDCLRKEGSKPDGEEWIFARYNKEDVLSAKGPFRRNDLLIPLERESVDLWRGVDWEFIKRIVAHPV